MGELVMVFDTETSDKTDFKAAFDAPHQPYLVQSGFKVFTKKREVIYEVGFLVDSTQLSGWNGINPDAQAVHGISEDLIRVYGYSPDTSCKIFNYWSERCGTFIAHNLEFDVGVMQCHMKRSEFNPGSILQGARFCTMKTTTNICKVPNPNGRMGYKWPKLQEAYQALIDSRGFKGAHNALADVNPCAEIFWKLVDNEYVGWKQDGQFFTNLSSVR